MGSARSPPGLRTFPQAVHRVRSPPLSTATTSIPTATATTTNFRREQQSATSDGRSIGGARISTSPPTTRSSGCRATQCLVDFFSGAPIDQLHDDRRGTNNPLDHADQQGVRGTIGFTYMLDSNFELIVDGGVRSKEQEGSFFSSPAFLDTDLTTKSLTPRVNITKPFFGLPSRIFAGIDLFDTDYDSHRSLFEGLAPIHIYEGGQEMLAGYVLQTVSILPTTTLSAGGRYQWNKTTARDTYDPNAPQNLSTNPQGLPLDQSETQPGLASRCRT